MVFSENKRLTEPYSFIFLKKLFSFSLIIMLIFYTCYQFSQFYNSIFKSNLIISKLNFDSNKTNITIAICGSNVNCSYKYAYSDSKYNDPKNCEVANEPPIEYTYDFSGCYRYSFTHGYKEIAILSPNITSIYLDGLETDKYYPPDVKLNLIHYSKEQTTVIYYSPTIIKRISNRFAYGLADGEGKEYVNFNIHTDTSDSTLNGTTFILSPPSEDIYYQEVTFYDLGLIISNIGGFFSSLSGIYVFLFGASKLAPWGFLQTSLFNCLCTGYRREFVRKLKNRYETIPFVSGRIKNVTLEERIQSIEKLLEEYYLNTDFLNLLLEDNCEKEISSESPRSTPEVVDDEIDDKVEIITAA
ncbi:unnamed protein product [Rhizophagus irregularis]|nr:unnamed protein product [Rhizophagus irregularis]